MRLAGSLSFLPAGSVAGWRDDLECNITTANRATGKFAGYLVETLKRMLRTAQYPYKYFN
jgi:hypothetical protein